MIICRKEPSIALLNEQRTRTFVFTKGVFDVVPTRLIRRRLTRWVNPWDACEQQFSDLFRPLWDQDNGLSVTGTYPVDIREDA